MAGNYDGEATMVNPITDSGMSTEKWAAILVIGSLVALIAIKRGFRGVSVGSLTGGVVRP